MYTRKTNRTKTRSIREILTISQLGRRTNRITAWSVKAQYSPGTGTLIRIYGRYSTHGSGNCSISTAWPVVEKLLWGFKDLIGKNKFSGGHAIFLSWNFELACGIKCKNSRIEYSVTYRNMRFVHRFNDSVMARVCKSRYLLSPTEPKSSFHCGICFLVTVNCSGFAPLISCLVDANISLQTNDTTDGRKNKVSKNSMNLIFPLPYGTFFCICFVSSWCTFSYSFSVCLSFWILLYALAVEGSPFSISFRFGTKTRNFQGTRLATPVTCSSFTCNRLMIPIEKSIYPRTLTNQINCRTIPFLRYAFYDVLRGFNLKLQETVGRGNTVSTWSTVWRYFTKASISYMKKIDICRIPWCI